MDGPVTASIPEDVQFSPTTGGLRFCTGAAVEWTWVDDYDFLKEQDLYFAVPWILLDGPELGYTSINIDEALAHGLTFRPLAQTHLDTRDWWFSEAVTDERRANPRFPLTAQREAEILSAWKARSG
jgi:2'-hydroxyisoflavone reductase